VSVFGIRRGVKRYEEVRGGVKRDFGVLGGVM